MLQHCTKATFDTKFSLDKAKNQSSYRLFKELKWNTAPKRSWHESIIRWSERSSLCSRPSCTDGIKTSMQEQTLSVYSLWVPRIHDIAHQWLFSPFEENSTADRPNLQRLRWRSVRASSSRWKPLQHFQIYHAGVTACWLHRSSSDCFRSLYAHPQATFAVLSRWILEFGIGGIIVTLLMFICHRYAYY